MDRFYDLILQDDLWRKETEKAAAYYPEAKEMAQRLLDGGNIALPAGILPLLVLKELTDERFEADAALGVPEEITISTLKDVNLWRKRYFEESGHIGTREFSWLLYSYLGKLYRVGRLQYERNGPRPWMKEKRNVLRVHIPEGEPLKTEDCLQSLEQAVSFHKRFFPALEPLCFTCESWLLCPALAEVLPADSNMVRFMNLWTKVCDLGDASAQAVQRAFGFDFFKKDLKSAPENTTLQRNLKRYLLEGNELNEFAGYIKINGKM